MKKVISDQTEIKNMIRLGTSGWYYDGWVGEFYPDDIEKREWLVYYSKHFDTVEVNASFYRLPFENMLKGWDRRTPDDFIFVMKGSRMVTHRKRLRNVESSLTTFYDRISMLGDKVGAVLWQLPPGIKRDDKLLENFLSELNPDFKNVVEFRDESWFDDGIYDLLREHGVSYCIVDCPDLPAVMKVTSDLAYIRFHGKDDWYNYDYSNQELGGWASRIKELDVKDVYIYFNNDQGGYAPKNCLSLKKMLND